MPKYLLTNLQEDTKKEKNKHMPNHTKQEATSKENGKVSNFKVEDNSSRSKNSKSENEEILFSKNQTNRQKNQLLKDISDMKNSSNSNQNQQGKEKASSNDTEQMDKNTLSKNYLDSKRLLAQCKFIFIILFNLLILIKTNF